MTKAKKTKPKSRAQAKSIDGTELVVNKVRVKKEPLVELEDLHLDDAKFKITLYLDGDVLEKAKEAAAIEGIKYQPFLNKLLRRVILNEKSDLEKRVEALEERVLRKSI